MIGQLQGSGVDPGEPAYLELEHITVAYAEHIALQDVTCRIAHGTRVAVVGPNGAGKSTLFKALAGLLPVRSGRILLHGKALAQQPDSIAYVPQRKEIDWGFPVTVLDVVLMGCYGRLGWLRRPGKREREAALRALERMGIAGLAESAIGELSGGQQQRVFLARALAQEPHILILDEPFNGVDVSTQETTLNLLEQLREQSVTVITSTHDLNMAMSHFEQVMLLNRRLVACGPAEEVITPEILTKVFGQQLLILPGGTVIVDNCCPPGREALGERA